MSETIGGHAPIINIHDTWCAEARGSAILTRGGHVAVRVEIETGNKIGPDCLYADSGAKDKSHRQSTLISSSTTRRRRTWKPISNNGSKFN